MSFALPLADALAHVGRPDLVKVAAADLAFQSRDATFISFIQATIKNASAEVLSLCEEHAKFWGIADQCRTAGEKLAAYQPEDIADKAFALVAEFNGEVVRKYAAYDRESVVAAATEFYDDRAKYPLEWRKNAAARLLGRAQAHDAVLPEYVERGLQKSAGLGWPTAESLSETMVQRLNVCLPSDDLDKLAQVINLMIAEPALQQNDEYVKQAMEVLAAFDTQYGLVDHYGQGVSLPEDMLADELTLQSLTKTASAHQSCRLINGRILELGGLDKTALEAVDPELCKLSQAELAEVLPTLPKGDADMLSRLVKTSAEAALTETQPTAPAAPESTQVSDPTSFAPAMAAPKADPNAFTDATADAMQAAPPVDSMTMGQPIVAQGLGRTIPMNHAGAGGTIAATNTAALRAGRPAPITLGRP